MSQRNKGRQLRSAKPMSVTHSVNDSREIVTMRQNEVAYKSRIRSVNNDLGIMPTEYIAKLPPIYSSLLYTQQFLMNN